MTDYPVDFYQRHREGMRRSARAIVPAVLDLVRPQSVIDLGCGIGTWLSVFKEAGVHDIFGVDGHWVDKDLLEIPQEKFTSADLTHSLQLERQFDLAMSLEVAEHLQAVSSETFVDSLTHLAPVVLFSAAIPYQGGKDHVNEQWPDYWVQHFRNRNYLPIDTLRKKIWQNENVEWWYSQNILLFVQREYLETSSSLKAEFQQTDTSQLSLVHPKAYLEAVEWHHRLNLMAADLNALLPPEGPFILVDEEQFRGLMIAGRRVLPFLERDGEYWGRPEADATAIEELERLRQLGARFIAFAWPAFWWLEHYSEFHRYLRSKFRCALENDRVIAFDLR